MTTTTVTLHASHLVGIANLVHFTPQAKRDRDSSPILATVEVKIVPTHHGESPSGGHVPSTAVLTAVATDRYVVGRYVVQLPDEYAPAKPVSFLLSIDLLKRLKPTTSDRTDFVITSEETGNRKYDTSNYLPATVTVKGASSSIMEPVIGGNYPPLERLIPDTGGAMTSAPLADDYSLNVAHIVRLSKLVAPDGTKDPEVTWRLSGTTSDTPHPTKRSPIVWTRSFGPHEYTVLQQPNLTLR